MGKIIKNDFFDFSTHCLLGEYINTTHLVNLQLNEALFTDFMYN